MKSPGSLSTPSLAHGTQHGGCCGSASGAGPGKDEPASWCLASCAGQAGLAAHHAACTSPGRGSEPI